MTFGPHRLSLNEVQPPTPVRLPRPEARPRPDQPPPPDHLVLGRALDTLTRRPVAAQRQAVQAPLRAAALARQEDGELRQRRQALEAALDDPGAAPVALPAPSVQQSLGARPRTPGPQTPGEWAAALRDRAGAIEGQPLDARQAAQFTALQRQVAHTLAQGFRQDRRAPQDRYGDYGDHLATLQRHPVSAPVAGVVLGLVPAAERPALQRAAAEGLERQLAHEAARAQAGSRLTVQRQLADLDAEAGRHLLERIQARRGAGNPLPEAVRRHLEGGLNHDLSRVRIHDDAEAHKLAKGVRALAFTTGTDIFFRRGHFDPNSRSGLELLAHEVTHTVQQSRGRVGGGVDPDAGLEAEARVMGAKLAQVMPRPFMPSTVMPSAKGLLPPVSPYAPGVYTPTAATARVQAGAAQRFALKPLHDLQPRSVQRFDLGGALGAAWDATGGKVVEKGKELVASGLKVIPGYKELCLAFGRDLVTGKAVGGSAEAILTALTNWVPGPLKDMLRALRETNVIGKAWEWFKGELGKLDLARALGEIAGAIGKADLGAAKSAVTRRISGVKNLIVGSARKIAEIGLTALTAGLGPLGQQIMAKLRGAGDVIVQVLRDPVKFARNLISAVGGGFKTFGSNAPRHLQNGIGQWLTGASGITFPASFSLEGVFMTALSVMGLTYQALRGKLVRALGPGGADKVGRAESTVQALQTMKGGLQHASEMKGEQGGVGKAVQDGVKSEVTKSLVLTGIQKLVTMLVPGGGFINAIIGAFQTVQTIVQQAAQIGQVVTSALGSVAAIAAGNISGAVGLIDRALGGAIPVALAWLGKLVGLGNLGGKIRNVINKVRGRLDRVVDKIVAKVKGIIEKALGKGKAGGKPGAPPATVAERNKSLTGKEKQEKLQKAVSGIRTQLKPLLNVGVKHRQLQSTLTALKVKYDLTALEFSRSGSSFTLSATVNPRANVLAGISSTEADIVRTVNKVGVEVIKDHRVIAAQRRIEEQRASGKGGQKDTPIVLERMGHLGAALDLRAEVIERTRGQRTYYEQDGYPIRHTQSARHARQTPGTLEVGVQGGGTYEKIASSLGRIRDQIQNERPNISVQDAERQAALLVDQAARGRLSPEMGQKYGQFLNEVAHLAFVVEPARNNSAIAFAPVLLDNLRNGNLSFAQAFSGRDQHGGLYPPSQQGAVSAMNRVEADSLLHPSEIATQTSSRSKKNTEQRERQLEFCRIWIRRKMSELDMDFDDQNSLDVYVQNNFKDDLVKAVLSHVGSQK